MGVFGAVIGGIAGAAAGGGAGCRAAADQRCRQPQPDPAACGTFQRR